MVEQKKDSRYRGIDNDCGLPRDVLPGKHDMSMFTPGGGGVHCLRQALKPDSVEV